MRRVQHFLYLRVLLFLFQFQQVTSSFRWNLSQMRRISSSTEENSVEESVILHSECVV